jgi:hypothetical protein
MKERYVGFFLGGGLSCRKAANVKHVKQITLTFWWELVFFYLGSGNIRDPGEMTFRLRI